MTDQIKNRVVGTIVIFAIAIIFLPDILDGKKQQLRDDFETIPLKPPYQAPDLSKLSPVKDNSGSSAPKPDPQSTKVQGTKAQTTKAPSTQNQSTVAPESAAKKSRGQQPGPTVVTNPVAAKKSVAKTQRKGAWVITVGSFKDPKNVKSLLDKLRKNGFTAFSVPSRPRLGKTSKVYVGPLFNKQRLVKLQPKLKAIINESGYISAYNPIEK